MNINRTSFYKWAAAGAVAAGALFATAANATDVTWSLGIAAPGLAFGVAAPPPVYYAPAPVYSVPAPVYYQPPPPVYYRPPPPAYYRPAPPVYYRPAPVYYGPPAPVYYGQGDHWRRRHQREWEDNDN